MHAFQKQANAEKGFSPEDPKIANSHIISYTGIEKREGLVTIAKRLLRSRCLLQHLSLSLNAPFKMWIADH